MDLRKLALLISSGALAACQVVDPGAADTGSLDGVWRGAVTAESKQTPMQAHVLDGLLLGVELDGAGAHSGELVMDNGELSGLYASRDALGRRDTDYTVLGSAVPYDRLEASLLGAGPARRMSLYYDQARSFAGSSYATVAGLYAYYGSDLQLTLSIDHHGDIEAYDDAGCAYFGQLRVPDREQNLYAVSLDVEGCALAGDYGFGIGSLAYGPGGVLELSLPIWFDEQDRVEAWILERVQ